MRSNSTRNRLKKMSSHRRDINHPGPAGLKFLLKIHPFSGQDDRPIGAKDHFPPFRRIRDGLADLIERMASGFGFPDHVVSLESKYDKEKARSAAAPGPAGI